MCRTNNAHTVCNVSVASVKATPRRALPWCLETKAIILWHLYDCNILPEDASHPDFASRFLPFIRPLCHIHPFGGDFDAYIVPKFDLMATHSAARWTVNLGLVHHRGGPIAWDRDITNTWFTDCETVVKWLRVQGKPDHQRSPPLGLAVAGLVGLQQV
ncbi:hypothetical protein ColLi_13110 [Colletotrichum liriopes]|uniref:Uncharacterized protein n=1 Tax=Colletotrichum liriopes TaxID=708192 RepID=A0AA37H1M9_9PEZI|nr:hypothetical protein ColLi_13110 [Colletotrichum liriopes]